MKTAVITGVSGGIGKATAKRLLKNGWRVFGLDIRAPKPLVQDGPFRFVQTDLTDMQSVRNAFLEVSKKAKRVDAIVHMAGIYDLNSLVEMSEEDFVRIFNVNLFSVFRVNKTFLPLLSKGSRILITSSELAPLDPLPFTGIYGITKTAVEKYAFSLRMELQLLGVRVIVLRPGAIDTGLLDVSTKRLDDFCAGTEHYACNSKRFKAIVDRVESRKIAPEKIAFYAEKALISPDPRLVYSKNRNPLLRMMHALPKRTQTFLIRQILTDRKKRAEGFTVIHVK